MALNQRLAAWSGVAVRHLPASANPLDVRWAARSRENRWNEPGEPTLYLAGDGGVLFAEYGRHFQVARTGETARGLEDRRVWQYDLAIQHMLDLCDPAIWRAIALEGAPNCFIDVTIARAVARYIRYTSKAQAIRVPSVGFPRPDASEAGITFDLTRWCLVLFLEKLPRDTSVYIPSTSDAGIIPRDLLLTLTHIGGEGAASSPAHTTPRKPRSPSKRPKRE